MLPTDSNSQRFGHNNGHNQINRDKTDYYAKATRFRHDSSNSSWISASTRFMNSLHQLTPATQILQHVQTEEFPLEAIAEERNCSSFVAGWNVLNLIQGIGILGIPYAVKLGGWPALIVIALVASITCFTGKLLIRCLYVQPNWMDCNTGGIHNEEEEEEYSWMATRLSSYASIGKRVWPMVGEVLVNTVSIVEMFGAIVLYIILMAKMVNTIVIKLWSNANLDIDLSIQFCGIVTSSATLPLLMVTRINIISWFSVLAVIALIIILCMVFIYCILFVQLVNWHNLLISPTPGGFAVSTGIIVFSFCAHAIFPNIEASMKRPESFSKMMNISFGIAAIVKVIFGGLAVLLFGAKTDQEIISNLFDISLDYQWFGLIICGLVFINAYFSTPLVAYVVCERLDALLLPRIRPGFVHLLDNPLWWQWLWIIITRLIILLAALFTSLMVPHFALIMSFIGSFTGSLLCFILPTTFFLHLFWHQIFRLQIILLLSIIVFGVLSGLSGMFFSSRDILMTFSVFH